MRIVDEDLQDLFDLPYTGLEDLSGIELAVVYAQWHNKVPVQTEGNEDEGWTHTVYAGGVLFVVEVNENMNIDEVREVKQ